MNSADEDLTDKQWKLLTQAWTLGAVREEKDRQAVRSEIRTHLEAVKQTEVYRERWKDLIRTFGRDRVLSEVRAMRLTAPGPGAHAGVRVSGVSDSVKTAPSSHDSNSGDADRAHEPDDLPLHLYLLAEAFSVPVASPLDPDDPDDPEFPDGVDRIVGDVGTSPLWALALLGLQVDEAVPSLENPRWQVVLDLRRPKDNLLVAVSLLCDWWDRYHGVTSHSRPKAKLAWDADFGFAAAFELLHHKARGTKTPQYRLLEQRLKAPGNYSNAHLRKESTNLIKRAKERVAEEAERLATTSETLEHAEELRHAIQGGVAGGLTEKAVDLLFERYPWMTMRLNSP